MNSEGEHCGLQACVQYFKENEGYHRIFCEMLAKWKAYGRITGTISMKNADAGEYLALQRLMGKPFEGKTLKFKMADFQQALWESKFKSVALEALLSAYFDEELVTTKSEKLIAASEKQQFWQEVIDGAKKQHIQGNDRAIQWLFTMQDSKAWGYPLVQTMFLKDRDSAKYMLMQVCGALRLLNQEREQGMRIRLAVLSARVTGNPHFFDRDRTAGKLLLNAFAFINACGYPQNAEEILQLYYDVGISPDDISSFTTAYGIHMYTKDGAHGAYEAFIEEKEPYVVTLSNLNRIVSADCPKKRVYIVENQMVFSQMCEGLKEKDTALLCTSGQVKTASLILIDLLCETGCRLYYSGDLDPEGICIADRLISRHPRQVTAWHMGTEDYLRTVSDEDIGEKRLKKLETVKDQGLLYVAAKVMSVKKAGYQEGLLEVLIGEIMSDAEQEQLRIQEGQ